MDFLDIYLNRDFGVRNFENTSAMSFIFYLNFSKLYLHFTNAEKKFRKSFPF